MAKLYAAIAAASRPLRRAAMRARRLWVMPRRLASHSREKWHHLASLSGHPTDAKPGHPNLRRLPIFLVGVTGSALLVSLLAGITAAAPPASASWWWWWWPDRPSPTTTTTTVPPTTTTVPPTTTTTVPPTTTTVPPTTTTTVPPTTTTTAPPPPPPNVFNIPSSVTGDCSADVTTEIDAWVASVPNGTAGNPNILNFGANACYRVDGTIGAPYSTTRQVSTKLPHLRGQRGDHRRVSARPPPVGSNRAGVGVSGSNNIAIQDFTIKGNNDGTHIQVSSGQNYGTPCMIPMGDTTTPCQGSDFNHDYEHNHGIGVFGSDHITVRNNHIYNVMGDGVTLAQGGSSNVTTNVVMTGNTVDGTGRMGVGVTSDDNVQMTNNVFDRVSYNTVDVENEAQQLTNITFSGNTINREWFGFWTAETGECLPRGNYVIDNNVMNWSAVNVANPIRLDSACSGPNSSGLEIKGNTLWHDQCAAGNPTIGYWDQAAVQIGEWDNVAIDNNRIIACGQTSVASVRLNNVGGTLEVNRNDARENPTPWVYGLDDVGNAPGVTACGNTLAIGPNQLTACP